MSTVLRVHEASRVYPGGVTALDSVCLEISSGELLAIVGPSGSGKSTLLNIMGTLDSPTSGTVEIDGTDVATLSDRRLSALRGRRLRRLDHARRTGDRRATGRRSQAGQGHRDRRPERQAR